MKIGRQLRGKIKELIAIVSPRTFARWVSGAPTIRKPSKQGRLRKPAQIRELIVQMARDTGWGYRRILGELKKLRIKASRSTVARVLQENGFDPGPKRGEGTWHEFVQRHIKTLWATDFFTKKVLTPRGVVEYYILFFLHVATRRVHLAGMTSNPDGVWMAQQARNVCMHFAEQGASAPMHIIRDRDSKFTETFCAIVESEGVKFKVIPPRSPNMNPHAEAWVQRVKRECLDWFIVFDEAHLRHILSNWLIYYHQFRPHQGLGNVVLTMAEQPPASAGVPSPSEVVCYEWLGGLLKHYERKVA